MGATLECDIKNGDWYAVTTIPGREMRVRDNILRSLANMGMEDMVFDAVVPEGEEVEYKDGKRISKMIKIYPGYVFVNMVINDKSWQFVRRVQGVTAIVGCGSKPVALQKHEMDRILGMQEMGREINIEVAIGEAVRIKDGPFIGIEGVVQTVDKSNGKIGVLIEMFGRENRIVIPHDQLEKP